MSRQDLTAADLFKLIEIRLEAIAGDRYASRKMTQTAASDALNDLMYLRAEMERLVIERDRYKTALERIAGIDCICYGMGVSNEKRDCPACTAAEALTA